MFETRQWKQTVINNYSQITEFKNRTRGCWAMFCAYNYIDWNSGSYQMIFNCIVFLGGVKHIREYCSAVKIMALFMQLTCIKKGYEIMCAIRRSLPDASPTTTAHSCIITRWPMRSRCGWSLILIFYFVQVNDELIPRSGTLSALWKAWNIFSLILNFGLDWRVDCRMKVDQRSLESINQ